MAKLLVLLALPALLLAGPALRLQDDRPIVTKEMVDHINSKGQWKASLDWAGNMTVREARRMLGALTSSTKAPKANFGALHKYLQVPASFDSRDQWPGCVGAIRNQADCGSCWAFSAVEVLADRFCIDQGIKGLVLSPQWLVSCDNQNYGCGGGYLNLAWEYMNTNGVPLETCDPYSSGDNDESGQCPDTNCAVYTATANAVSYDNPADIQAAIMQGGPVQTAFTVYEDFYSYTSGIYTQTSDEEVGGHAVKIIGWGNQSGTNYWIVANSWGADWGMSGFFWIAFGQCGIDTDAIAGNAGTAPN
jgi:cathepsin B